ncbi:Amidase [Oleidesulfovibrio alaskensis G20]|jgi:amidase|uniref:Amidase n=1 Tax=Oleidesulfovibrio alaskensis (strain ATCC BAA-1058 / DSM 17464 / G20) TaxID=207559 RepID=Q315S7_OLEA2|nr:amidase [Oleidesulfovibrio alaskensis]ABB37319.1 Amidase [Oleidesulfovibrio alaskensis G20]MBG0773225.1 amidase [Oleidesulfovibrio alaskensis]
MTTQSDTPPYAALSMQELGTLDAVALRGLIRSGQITPDEVLHTVFQAMEALNPAINAVVQPMKTQAYAELRHIDPEAALYGVPYLLKDLGPSYAGVPTRMACMALKDGFFPGEDSHLTHRFRTLGMVPAGKSATPEFGLTATTDSVLHGQTRNPWDVTRSPGGSSGGSASAVAAGIVPVAHGNDGGGSIRIPAAACGLVGFKCSRGLLSWAPELGECWGALATNGVLTRTVRDSAAALDGLCGTGLGDPYPFPRPPLPFSTEIRRATGRLKIGYALQWPAGAAPASEDCRNAVMHTARLLEGMGHHVEEAAPDLHCDEVADIFMTIVAAQVIVTLGPLISPAGMPDERHAEKLTRLLWEKGQRETGAHYAGALNRMHLLGRAMARFFERYDVLLTPVMTTPPAKLGAYSLQQMELDDYAAMLGTFIPYTPPFNMAGSPAVSLPLYATEHGLPVGVQLGAGTGRDGLLFRLAARLEEAAPWHTRVPAVHVSRLETTGRH